MSHLNSMKSQIYHFSLRIPSRVFIERQNSFLKFSGPLGNAHLNLKKIDPYGLGALSVNNNHLEIISSSKSFFGLFKKLIENKIIGVSRGFLMYLKIIGIGYRSILENQTLVLKLGYSHDIVYQIPSSIKVFLVDSTTICVFGVDKNQISQIATKIRNLRQPGVYKGKGIRLVNETLNLKQGKKK